MLGELLKRALVVVAVLAGLATILHLPIGGPQSSTEKQAAERSSRFEWALSRLDKEDFVAEIGSAYAYAYGCNMEVDAGWLASALAYFGLRRSDFERGGRYRRYWEDGAERIATLFALDDGDPGRRAVACSLALPAYGADGSIVPGLLQTD